jgi:hypothetical protein
MTRLPRRALASLLAASGGAVLTAGCGPSPVATSPEVARDPLAVLDPALWDARSAEELRALPVQGAAAELSTWSELGPEAAVLDPARDLLLGYLEAAYLAPAALRGLEDEESLERVSAAAPEFWRDSLRTAWDDGSRSFYALTLAAPFRPVGRPALSAGWFRTETDEGPALALGTTIAWTALETATRAVGVLAYRVGILLGLAPDGSAVGGSLRVTVHGLDGCATAEQDGLLVPALAADERHRAVQRATRERVLGRPRIPLPELLDEESALFAADAETHLGCD